MKFDEIEKQLGFKFPARHKSALRDKADPIHECRQLLVPNTASPRTSIVLVNQRLRSKKRDDPWPTHLVAFAICDPEFDEFAVFDTRYKPYRVESIDAEFPVAYQLSNRDADDTLSFDRWYELVRETHDEVAAEFEKIEADVVKEEKTGRQKKSFKCRPLGKSYAGVRKIVQLKSLPNLRMKLATAPRSPCMLKEIMEYLKLELENPPKRKDLNFRGYVVLDESEYWVWDFGGDDFQCMVTVERNKAGNVIGFDENRDNLKPWQFALATHLRLF